MNIAGFEKIAPYLTHPLVLVGFVLMLAYGVHIQLMKSGLRQVSQKDSSLIIRLFLRYGFWLALVLLLAGFGLSVWNSYMGKENNPCVEPPLLPTFPLTRPDPHSTLQASSFPYLPEAVNRLSTSLINYGCSICKDQ
ncbi:hypothetical protein KKHLCK_10360 [Candidatus Electrothrix laxa]